jgi:hypothetical protein
MPARCRGRLKGGMHKCRMLLLGSGLAWALAAPVFAGGEIPTAVFSQTFNGYARTKLADGSCKPETFALGDAGRRSGRARDDSIDRYSFAELVRVLGPYLARQNYVSAPSPEKTDLMIVVHWGTTIPYDRNWTMAMGMENSLRDSDNACVGALLGYWPELERAGYSAPSPFTRDRLRDLVADLEDERYYVILAAFDFQLAWRKKQLKPLWITRVSIRGPGHGFARQVDTMVQAASRYFGEESHSLIRDLVPEGKVKIGEPKVIGVVPDGSRIEETDKRKDER